jgi:cytochrome d ubiquinol oxidase subunit I
MAAAELLCVTPDPGEGAGFTVAAFGKCAIDANGQMQDDVTRILEIPKMLSFLAYSDGGAQVVGMDQAEATLEAAYTAPEDLTAEQQAALDFIPSQQATFWTFRLMIAFGVFSAVLAVVGLIALRGGRTSGSGFLKAWALISLPTPFLGAAFGWIFTEIGRQPFIVYPVVSLNESHAITGVETDLSLSTANAVSPVVGAGSIWLTVICFTLLYAVLAVAWFYLMKRYSSKGLNYDESIPEVKADLDDSKPLTFSY